MNKLLGRKHGFCCPHAHTWLVHNLRNVKLTFDRDVSSYCRFSLMKMLHKTGTKPLTDTNDKEMVDCL